MAISDYTLAALAATTAALAWRICRVRQVRFMQLDAMQEKYKHLASDLSAMTYDEANDIMKVTHYWDFPWSSSVALSFALFKTYAVPTISAVLCKTNELASPKSAGRRAEDTVVITAELLTQGLDSVRGSTSLARMNYLHSRYGKLITRDDLLFTLSLFIFEPVDYISEYEWRPLCELEIRARYVFWREIGARMGIENIPRTHQDLRAWKEKYAEKAMVYAPTNPQTGDGTVAVLLKPFPAFMRPLGKQATVTLLDERVRKAFGWPRASPSLLYWAVPGMIKLRGLFVGYLLYPRISVPGFLTTRELESTREDGVKETRIMRKGFLFEPWYVPAGCSGLGKLGLGKPGGAEWHSEGWKSESLGPDKLQHQGVEATLDNGRDIRDKAAVCPFFV